MSMGRATQGQWMDFSESIIWMDLRELMMEIIELNRDLLEGRLTQAEGMKESDEALRGRNRSMRDLLARIEGWADGTLPIEE